MSENTNNGVLITSNESLNDFEVSSAMDEKLQSDQAAQHPNANDIERELALQEEDLKETVEEETEENQEDDKFSSRFAALSRKEKDIRSRERDLEDKIAQFEARMQELEQSQAPQVEEKEPEIPLEYKLKKNPLEALSELGLTYEKLTELALNDGKLTPDMQMQLMREEIEKDYKSKFDELQNKLLEKEKQEEEAKYETAINQFKSEINDFVDGSEEYELIQANDAYDLVYDVIEEYYQENGRILDKKEAADQVEQFLEEEAQKLFEKSNKLKSRLTGVSKPATQPPRQSPTLSNSHAVKGTQTESQRLLSREESIARLAPMIKWED
jgi:GTPase SAR1 family protein